MTKPDEPSIIIRIGGFLLFLLLSICAYLWFAWDSFSLYEQISANASVVTFSNGGFYALGGGIAFSTLTYGVLHQVIFKLPITEKITKRVTRGSIIGIGLMIILPQIIHHFVEDHMKSNNYMICGQVSSSWLMYKHIAYVTDTETCAKLFIEKQERLSEPLF
jgi:hypothetical protein